MPTTLPLISCLCITHKKPEMLKRAIDCFESQTYRNKQMVIVFEDHDLLTAEFLKRCDDERDRILQRLSELSGIVVNLLDDAHLVLKLVNRVLKLLIQHHAIRHNDHRVEYPLILLSVQRR